MAKPARSQDWSILPSGTYTYTYLAGKKRRGFRVCVRNIIPSSVPQGRLNLAQDAVLGWVGRDA